MNQFYPVSHLKKFSASVLKSIKALLLILILGTSRQVILAQNASSTWLLTVDGTVSNTGNVIGAGQAWGTQIATPSYSSGNGCSAAASSGNNGWSNTSLNANSYYEYSLAPASGNNLTVNSVSFFYSVSGGSMNASVYYSLNNFSSSTQLGVDITGFANTSSTTQFTNSPSIVVPSGQTLKIRVFGWGASASTRTFRNKTFVISGSTASSVSPSIAISTGGIAAGNVNSGQTNVVLQRYDLAVTTTSATLNGLTITTVGTYAAVDISNFKCWYQNSSTFNATSAILLSTKIANLGPGSQVFPTFTSQNIASASTGYIFITTDIASGATNGNTINVATTAFSNISFLSGTKTGTDPVPAGGTQTISAVTPSITVSSPNQIAAANVAQGATGQLLSNFQATVTTASATLNSITVVTAGTYSTASFVTNYKLYYNATSNTFGTAGQIGTTQSSVASGGTVTFGSLATTISSGSTGYFWVIADIAINATINQTVNIAANPTFSFASGTPTGTISAGGTQTFIGCTPTNVTSPVASSANVSSVLTWTNPVCYDEILIVAATAINTGVPTGDGTAYTGNLVYGSGTVLGNGFVVYKGSTSPETVTNLINGTPYFFKFFTRRGNTWTSGIEVNATPNIPGFYWNGGNTSANPANGGDGIWGTTNTWRQPSSTGSQATWVDGNVAIFAGASGTVTLPTAATFTTKNIQTTGYNFTSALSTTLTGDILQSSGITSTYSLTAAGNTTINFQGNFSGGTAVNLVPSATGSSVSRFNLGNGSSSTLTWSTPIIVTGTGFAAISTGGSGTGAISNFSGNITGNGSRLTLGGGSGYVINFSGIIGGTNDVRIASAANGGAGTVLFSGASTFTGNLSLNNSSSGIVKISGGDNRFPTTAIFTMGETSSNGDGTFDLNGLNQQFAGLTNGGASGGTITNGVSSTVSTLTISGSTSPSAFSGIIQNGSGTVALKKAGTGTLILSGSNTFTGGTTMSAGILQLGLANTLPTTGTIILSGGTLSTAGFSQTMGTLNLIPGTASAVSLGTGSHTITFANSSSLTPWGAGSTLTINGWTGIAGASGTGGKIFVGVGGLTIAQLAKITFTGFPGTPIILASGELVPTGPILAITGTTNNGSSCINIAAAPITYTITNTGASASGITVTSNNPQFVVSALSSTTIANGGTATFKVTFTPTSAGAQSATITVSSTTANNNSPTIGLTGTGYTPITVTPAHTDVSCFGSSTGTITLTGSGGTAPYNYTLTGQGTNITGSFIGLAAGTYSYSVTDAHSCTPVTGSVTITQPASALSASITAQTNVSCFGGNNGSATVTAAGGTSPYTYSWNTSPVQTTATATGLIAGTYTVTVTDFKGCTTTASVTITQPASALSASITAQTNVSCFGGNNGSATVTASGGTSPYTYSWNTNPVQTTATATGLIAGTYTVTVTDFKGCTTAASVTITQPASALSASITAQTNVSCFGGNNGSATVTASGGTSPYTYSWNTSPVQTTATATGLIAGTYTVTVTDSKGCTTTASVTITQPAAVTATVSHTDATCFGTLTGTVTLSGSGGTTPYSYTLGSTTQSSGSFTGLAAGTYSYSVTDANTCTPATGSVIIAQPTAVTGTLSGSAAICSGSSTSITINLTGDGTISGTLSEGTSFNGTAPSVSVTVSPASTTTYTITSISNVTCTGTGSGSSTVTVNPLPTATISASSSLACQNSTAPSITFTGITGTAPFIFTYTINGGSPQTIMSDGSGVATVSVPTNTLGTTTYALTNVSDTHCSQGQTASASVTVNPDTWKGIDNDWNQAYNWTCGVPSINSDVYIPGPSTTGGSNPSIFVGTIPGAATAHNITIASGATLTVTSNLLQVSGTISNAGSFDLTSGTIEFNGTSAQLIPVNAFAGNVARNVIISNNVSLTPVVPPALTGAALYVTGTLTFGTGVTNVTFTTNDNLTLKSSEARTASVGMIDPANHITGKVTVERYIATGTGTSPDHPKTWQLLAVPTSGTGANLVTGDQSINAAWMEGAGASNVGATNAVSAGNPVPGYGTMITSNVAGATTFPSPGFDAYTAPGPTVKVYNYLTNGYDGPASTTVPVYNQKGYFVFVRGDRSVSTATGNAVPTILRTKGLLFTPDNLPPVSTVHATKFESVGNPYASPVDLRSISHSGSTTEFYIVWDPRLGGSYNLGAFQTLGHYGPSGDNNYYAYPGSGSYPVYDPNNLVSSNYLQSGQAFFIQTATTATTDGTVSFAESNKATLSGSETIFSRVLSGNKSSILRTTLNNVNSDGSTGTVVDGVMNEFGDGYTSNVNGRDARKLINTGENLSIRNNGTLLSTERRHTVVGSDTIFLNLTSERVQQYQFNFSVSNLTSVDSAVLIDNYLQTRRQLSLKGNTAVNFNVVNVAGSYAPDRFMIVFKALAVLPTAITSITATQQGTGVDVQWSVSNEHNIQQYIVERSTDSVNFTTLTTTRPTGNNGTNPTYVITDAKPVSGNNYYRVQMADSRGNVSYSTIVKVTLGIIKNNIQVYPNPVTDGKIHLQFSNEAAGKFGIRLLDKSGQVIVEKQVTRQQGNSTELLQWNYNIAHGIYKVEITRPDGSVKNINVLY